MSRARKFVVVTALILTFTILTSGQTPQPVQLVIDPVIQKDAPVQVAGIEGNGDNARDVLSLVVGQGIVLAMLGTSLGIGVAVGVTRYLASMLYDVSPNDPLTMSPFSLTSPCPLSTPHMESLTSVLFAQ